MILNRDILILISIALLIALVAGGVNYWKRYQEERLNQLAEIVYAYEKEKISPEEALEKVKDTPYAVYISLDLGKDFGDALTSIKEADLKKLLLERKAYELYKKGKPKEALKKLDKINKKDFNYPSALLLKAFIYEDLGYTDKARLIYNELFSDYGETYFGKVAYARLLELEIR